MNQIELSRRLTEVVPSKKQLLWQQLEFTAFFHYGMNTFTDREWGDGTESPELFDPKELDTDQWCENLVKAGIRGCILTAKHHDGFCLWPSAYTEHSVKNSPFGKDVVQMLSQSCQKYGIKFGIYLSPWDRHEKTYGYGKAYDDYFCNQLTELLTNYGPVYTVWFDGACGEGKNGKKQVYDWARYYDLIHTLQPDTVISVCGPDVRWCGNEAGICRESEWSVVPAELSKTELVQEQSQHEDNNQFREQPMKSTEKDLGSRKLMAQKSKFIWYPSEVDTSIRPGWFYHEQEQPKPLEKLLNIYINTVGGNSVLLLNIPPCKDGYLVEEDCKRLEEIGAFIHNTFAHNAMEHAVFEEEKNAVHKMLWNGVCYQPEGCPEEEGMPWLSVTFAWEKAVPIEWIVLKEHIVDSQRVESFFVEVLQEDGKWKQVYSGTVIGYKKIAKLNSSVLGTKMRITFTQYRMYPTLEFVGVYSVK